MDTATEIGSEIRALAAHYPRRRLSGHELDRWITDYVGDLLRANWTGADCRIACAMWRVSSEKRMPSPGELLAKFRHVDYSVSRTNPAEAAPYEPVFRAPENLRVGAMVAELAAQMRGAKRQRIERLPGETSAQQGERLWPSHRVDRMEMR